MSEFWKKNPLFDLEPILGTCDHLYDDMIYEISSYPERIESCQITLPSTRRTLMKQYLENKESPDKRKYLDVDHVGLQYWDRNTRMFDERITLVQQNKELNGDLKSGFLIDHSVSHIPNTWNYINSLPIDDIYRAIIIIGQPRCEVPLHKDWVNQEKPLDEERMHCLFINPRNNRPFYYVKDSRKYFTNSSLFLMNNGMYDHGVNSEEHKTALIRIYCKLNDEFCRQNGIYVAKS